MWFHGVAMLLRVVYYYPRAISALWFASCAASRRPIRIIRTRLLRCSIAVRLCVAILPCDLALLPTMGATAARSALARQSGFAKASDQNHGRDGRRT